MANQFNATTVCGLPAWIAFPANDSTSYINDAIAVAVNITLGIFAFFSNLIIIITVAKTPSLQRPSNILLCSLASVDCLVGLLSQPLFFIWRLMLHRARQSCDLQIELFESRYVLNTLTLGGSFVIFTLISFDRARALSNPVRYRTEVRNKGMLIFTCSYQIDETGFKNHFDGYEACVEDNRPFARSGHMVRNKLHWDASYTAGLSKQGKVRLDWYEFLCFESPTA